MGHIDLLKTGGFLTVFIISIIAFSVGFAADNQSDISLTDDSRFNDLSNNLRSNATEFQSEAENVNSRFFSTTLESGDEHAGGGGQFKGGVVTAGTMTVTGFTAAFDVIFGGGSEFSFIKTTFVSLLMMIGTYFAIKAWLGRDPE